MNNVAPLDYQWTYVGDSGFSESGASNISLSLSLGGQPYVAFSDQSFEGRATVMMFDGNTWEYVGNPGFSLGYAFSICLAFSPSGEPFISFVDDSLSRQPTVMRFDGNNWIYVGNAGFGTLYAWGTSLAFSQTGEVFVAFDEWQSLGARTSVMTFDGSSWVYVGDSCFSPADGGADLVISPTGQLFVAGSYGYNAYYVSVMKFNGINWEFVGGQGFQSHAIGTKLAFNPPGDPYVIFIILDKPHFPAGALTVMRFDGYGWLLVGDPGAAAYGGASDIAFSPSGELYISFSNVLYNHKVSVMKFDGTTWEYVGEPGISPGHITNSNLEFSPDGVPFIAYSNYETPYKAVVMKYDSIDIGIPEYQNQQFTIFPNPALNDISITLTNSREQIIGVEIFDLIGRKVMEIKSTCYRCDLNIEKISIGTYIVKVRTTQSLYIGKFCKG
jgi:hypothetical protein